MYDTILFLDFDGTITSEETLEGSMQLCIDPSIYEEEKRALKAGERSLADTLHLAFSIIPSGDMDAILDYVDQVPLRPGFEELLDLANDLAIPVVVISGGLKNYIERKLAPYKDKILALHGVEVDLSGEFIKLKSAYETEGELMQKTLIMEQYDYGKAISVGDNITDYRMALASDRIFARDTLAKILEKDKIPYTPWEDFYDVARSISSSR
ncbi:MAG: 2-hydroxy-3-keto-5-methylthiopentenyl-1-phosphate phosphatase [Clostridiaceae bacterium]|nr:2-hydroxy-3-keto-5-methylthiopentenyl-1-phosphate phosphatase [Clostridiaceae bacterium]